MSASPAKSQWREYKNSDGRVYWSHAVTKQSVWERPDELKSPFERALAKTVWKQYESNGRPYYVNGTTKETRWDMPEEVQEVKKRVEREEAYQEEKRQRRERGEPSPSPPPRSRSPSLEASNDNAMIRHMPSPSPSRSPSPPPRKNIGPVITFPPGGFLTHERAVEGFTYLLKREGVDETWTWDQAMRKLVLDPLYNSLQTLAEKKQVFENHIQSILREQREEKEARIARVRPILHKLFAQHPGIKSYSTTKTADKLFAKDKNYRNTPPDERHLLLDEYTSSMRFREEAEERERRTRNVEKLKELVKGLDGLSVGTRWRAAHDVITGSEAFKADRELREVELLDILGVWDDYAQQLEREHADESRRFRVEEHRRQRKARDGFRDLLHEMEKRGDLTARSKWKDTLKFVRDDERYKTLLGVPGSNPLEMWMDAVDDLAEETLRASEKLSNAFRKIEKEVGLDTTWDEFESWVKEVHMDTQIDEKLRREVYHLVHDKLVQARQDEERRAERKRRHRIDDLRYALKKVSRHLDVDMTYEEALPHMEGLDEFKEIKEEEDRRSAFTKFVQRQKEKLREAESSTVASGSPRKDRRYSSTRDGRRGDDNEMDVDRRDRDRDRAGDRRGSTRGDRSERDRDRDRERDNRDEYRRGSRRDERSRDRRHRRREGSEVDMERDHKRPRRESDAGEKPKEKRNGKDDVEEGEI